MGRAAQQATIHYTYSDQSGTHAVNERVYVDPLLASYGSNAQWFQIYCVDITHNIGLNSIYDVAPKASADGKILADPPLANHDLVAKLLNTYANAVNNSVERGALQLALWEAVTDGYSGAANPVNPLTGGDFYITDPSSADMVTEAATYLDYAYHHGSSAPVTWLDPTSHAADGGQGMVTDNSQEFGPTGGSPSATPEPGSAVLLTLGLLSLAGYKLRRTNRRLSSADGSLAGV